MAKKGAGGRPAIYSPKDGKVQVRAITKKGAAILNRARRMVKTIAQWPGHVSDGDVIDYLLRSWEQGPEKASVEISPKGDQQ